MSEEKNNKRGPGRPMGSKNKKKTTTLASLNQAHGKDEEAEQKIRPTTLAQIWGDESSNKYGTSDAKKYKEQISEMGRADLFRHATKLGMVPVDNLTLLRGRMEKEFNKHVMKFNAPASTAGPAKNVPSEIQSILDGGK
jgi:hypothetical protein|tara:strand:+ start:4507 stop:4923 length:417 start_codon:yes stop_codon:yes gene_type:complete